MFCPFFASDQNFLDPQTTKDGKPYGPQRFTQIVQECWFISKHIHTSYNEILDISPTERKKLIDCIVNELKKTKDTLDKMDENNKAKNKRAGR